jgi:hypothetical protein
MTRARSRCWPSLLAEERGIWWEALGGTSNQSDFISHFVANHMFCRLSLEGSRRICPNGIPCRLWASTCKKPVARPRRRWFTWPATASPCAQSARVATSMKVV